MDKLNADGNLGGRVSALVIIAAALIGVGRVLGMNVMCPLGGSCVFSAATAQPAETAALAKTEPAKPKPSPVKAPAVKSAPAKAAAAPAPGAKK